MEMKNAHDFIVGLVQELPEPGAVWPAERRQKWIAVAETIFGLLYKAAPDAAAAPPVEE